MSLNADAQQYGLYNSRTLFDSFENPSQQAFQADSSRKFAFNFFIPTFSNNSLMAGPAVKSLRPSIFDGTEFSADYERHKQVQHLTKQYQCVFVDVQDLQAGKELPGVWHILADQE